MKIGDIDLYKDVLIVAEIGNNHEGSFSLAEEIVGRAAEAGINAVKFQTFRTELLVSSENKARFEQLKSFELTYDQFERLSKLAKEAGLIFMSTPFDLESAEFLNSIVPAFKISSGDNTFYPLIEKVAGFGKPIMLSTGLADMAQLRRAKALIERVWGDSHLEPGLAVLHCVSSYPVKTDQTNLRVITRLKEELRCTVGYSDHTIGIDAAVLAVALGARIIEKHFTIDKDFSDFHDHQLSADHVDMVKLVKRIKETLAMLGTGEKVIQQGELQVINSARRSIVARRDLPKGASIRWDDITWIRPLVGLPPGSEHLVVGKSLSKPVRKGEAIIPEILYQM